MQTYGMAGAASPNTVNVAKGLINSARPKTVKKSKPKGKPRAKNMR